MAWQPYGDPHRPSRRHIPAHSIQKVHWRAPPPPPSPRDYPKAATAVGSIGNMHLSASAALGSFEIQDSLASASAPSLKYLARSATTRQDGFDEEYFDAEASLSRTSVSSAISTSSDHFHDASDGLAGPESTDASQLPGAARHQAWVVEFESWKPESPEYKGLDAHLQTRLTSLLFFCNRPTVAALMCLGTDLGEAVKAGSPAKPPSTTQPRQLESQESVSDFSSLEDSGKSRSPGPNIICLSCSN